MKQKPHILMVLDHPFPHDLRVENEAFALIDAGFKVTVLSVSSDKRSSIDSYKSINIIRHRVSKQWQKKIKAVIPQFALYNRIIKNAIIRTYESTGFNFLHLHDLYLFGAGLKAKKDLHIPIIGDLHENYVDALQHYHFTKRFPMKYILDINKWKQLELEWVNAVDKVIVVIEEAYERVQSLGVNKQNIIVVPNTININEFDEYSMDNKIINKDKGKFKIIYTGGFDLHRGIDYAIKAIPLIKSKIKEVKLVLVGDGLISSKLKKLTKEIKVEEYVIFEGWQPQHLIKSYIQGSDICIIPHKQTVHTNATIPHKLFHYMYMKKPVIVSNCNPLERIVKETKAGLVHESGNPESIADNIIELYNNESLRKQMGISGFNAIMEKYNWQVSSRELVDMYKHQLITDHNS